MNSLEVLLSQYLIRDVEDDSVFYSYDYSTNFDELMGRHFGDMLEYVTRLKPPKSIVWDGNNALVHYHDNELAIIPSLDDRLIFNFSNYQSFDSLVWQCVFVYCGTLWSDAIEDGERANWIEYYCSQWLSAENMLHLKEVYLLSNTIPSFQAWMANDGCRFNKEAQLFI